MLLSAIDPMETVIFGFEFSIFDVFPSFSVDLLLRRAESGDENFAGILDLLTCQTRLDSADREQNEIFVDSESNDRTNSKSFD